MKKKLYLLRHAEARVQGNGEKDKDRMLTSKGMQDASRMGSWLYKNQPGIAMIYTSQAERAMQTASLIADQLRLDNDKLQQHEDLYEASARLYMDIVRGFNDSSDRVMLVGHNPVIMYFAEYISGQSIEGGMKTCTLIEIECETDAWEEVPEKKGRLINIVHPDDLI
ncbi:MAG: phosphohistidine phosphatase SixA [Cyclobacteriaceae bacterium]